MDVQDKASNRYINRELSWLQFNSRVLEEAKNPDVPLMERLRFLSISASNLDEFYMVRVAGLRTQELAGHAELSADGMTAGKQLSKITKQVDKITKAQDKCWTDLRSKMKKQNIRVRNFDRLSEDEIETVRQLYELNVLPLLSPISVGPAQPFPFIANLGFGLVVELKRGGHDDENHYGLIPVPAHVPRFIPLSISPKGKAREYVSIEHVLKYFAGGLFSDAEILESGTFRVTRDSDIAVDEEAEDLVRHFEFLLKKRRRGRVIRLELTEVMSRDMREFLMESFECWDEYVQDNSNFIGMSDLSQLITSQRRDLTFKPFQARFPERIREFDGDCFGAIAAKDILVHHPYEEFSVVVQFLQQAAHDPHVLGIKQTLYRTSDDSPIVQALIEAAENGKNVTALLELKARFDEATNIRWARDLERAGAHVVYGFVDYKTHAKVSLVIRREGQKLRTYTHLGTGNYHAQNAKIYTDLALFTADPAMGRDVGQVFNFVTSQSPPKELEKLAIAPIGLRETIYANIDAEMAHAKAGRAASIWAKMNALVDRGVIDRLYEASQAGVQIDLVVRGICCLRPGVEGLSENIRVKSIVGRFLEHSRIVCFGNGAHLPNPKAKIFFSSADWMPRNLNNRVETFIPVEDPTVRRQVQDQIMVANLNDNVNSWAMRENGRYSRVSVDDGTEPFSAHAYFMNNPSLSGRGKALDYNAPKVLTLPVQHEAPVKAAATLTQDKS
ncbi:MAG: RNA degradosome polyphosphate kinase [Maricaulaceae bacterium]